MGYFSGGFRALYGARGYEAGGWYGDSSAYRVANGIPDHRPADPTPAKLDGSGLDLRGPNVIVDQPSADSAHAKIQRDGLAGGAGDRFERPAPTVEFLGRDRDFDGKTLEIGYAKGAMKLHFQDGFTLRVQWDGTRRTSYSLGDLEQAGRAKLAQKPKPLGDETRVRFQTKNAFDGALAIVDETQPRKLRRLKHDEKISNDALLKVFLSGYPNGSSMRIKLDFGNGHSREVERGFHGEVDVAKLRQQAAAQIASSPTEATLFLPKDMDTFLAGR